MTKLIPYAAFASILLTPLPAIAEDAVPADSPVLEEDNQPAVDDAIDAEVFVPEMGDTDTDTVDPAEQTVPVADDVMQPPDADPDFSDEEQLLEEFARYRRLLQQGTLDAADIAAKHIVEMAIKVYGPQSRETANALNNLGIVQHRNGQYDAAIQNFTSAVEIIEAVEDRLNAALVNPLKGLGAAQLSNGRPDQAHKTFGRAVHITQVNEGPHNLDQVEILESLAETSIRLGNTKAARKLLDRIHIINVKHFEKNPLGLLPSLMSRADWQHKAGYYADERTTYRRAIRIIESSSGKDDSLLVEPLRRLGESFYFIDLTTQTSQSQSLISTGEIYFKRAHRIAEKSDELDWRERAKATLALADYYIFVDSQNRAKKMYRQVWKILSPDDAEQLAQRDEWFGQPGPIWENPLPSFAGKPPEYGADKKNLATGKIVVDYAISRRGRVRDLRSEAFPPEFTDMQRVVHREIRGRIYRPQIVDGEPTVAEGQRFEHEFTYLVSDLEELREANAENEQQASN